MRCSVDALHRQHSGRVDSAPASIAPRQIPMRALWFSLWDVVDARRSERLTAQQARKRHPASRPQTVSIDRFVGIDGAGRQVSAVVADEWRQRMPVDPDQRTSCIARQSSRRMGEGGIRQRGRVLHVHVAATMGAVLRGSRSRNCLLHRLCHIFATYRMLSCSSAASAYALMRIPPDTISAMSMRKNSWVIDGTCLRRWGKEPI